MQTTNTTDLEQRMATLAHAQIKTQALFDALREHYRSYRSAIEKTRTAYRFLESGEYEGYSNRGVSHAVAVSGISASLEEIENSLYERAEAINEQIELMHSAYPCYDEAERNNGLLFRLAVMSESLRDYMAFVHASLAIDRARCACCLRSENVEEPENSHEAALAGRLKLYAESLNAITVDLESCADQFQLFLNIQ